MIIVTGANGQLGRAIAERLLELLPIEQIGVSVREPDRARELAARGVRVRRGDFNEPASLVESFAGAERLLIISTDLIGQRVSQHRNAVDAAKQAGVPHVLYTSITDPDPSSPFAASADHAATEAYIRESGLRYTFLGNGLYMGILAMFAGGALTSGTIEAAADGPTAYVARDDLAEATANLLAVGGHIDQTLKLTGPEALDLAQLATIVSQISGRQIEHRVLSNEAYRERLIGSGMPAAGADGFLSIFAALRERRFAAVHPDLEQLLGRKPQTAAAFLQAMLAAQPA